MVTNTPGADLPRSDFWTPIRVMVITYWLSWGFAALDRLLITVLFPFITVEFSLDYTKMGFVVTCMSFGFIVMNFVGGGLSDKYGRKRIIFPAIMIFSLGSFITGFCRNFAQLIGIRTVLGAAEGAYITAAICQVSEESPPGSRGANVGFLQSGMPLFAMLIAPLYGTQVATHLGWRWAFLLTIVPGVLLALFAKYRIKETARFATAVAAGPEFTWRQVLRERNVLLMIALCVCWMVYLWAWLSFGSVFFTKIRGLSAEATGVMLTALGLGGTLGSWIVPSLSDHFGRKPILIGSIAMAFIATIVQLNLPDGAFIAMYAMLVIAAFGVWGTAPIFMGIMTSESVPFEGSGKAYGAVTGTGECFGAMIAPTVLGIIGDRYGLTTTMWVGCAALVGVLIFSCFLRETAPRIVARRASATA